MNRNSLNIVNYKLIGGGQNNYLNAYNIRNYNKNNYRELSRNR